MKMKYLTKISALFTLTYLLLCISCKNDVELATPDIKREYQITNSNSLLVDSGMIRFNSANAFNCILDSLLTLPFEDRMQFGSELGFRSFALEFSEAIDELESIVKEKDYQKWLAKHAGIIEIKDNAITPRINNPLISCLINKEGMLRIQSDLYLFGNDFQVISSDCEVEETAMALENGIENPKVRIFRFESLPNKKYASCGDYQNKTLTVSDPARRGKLECYHLVTVTKRVGENIWDYKTDAIVVGFGEKKNIWGNWVVYNTKHSMVLNYKFMTNSGISKYVWNKSIEITDEVKYCIDINTIATGTHDSADLSNDYKGVYTYMDPNKYNHRGLKGNWVEIFCGENTYPW
jgi:hypothetical protein